MNDKIARILLLAVVCLAGITLALVVAQPTPQTVSISSYYPAETNITNTEGATRTFNVTINQTVNASWLINGTEVFNQSGVNFSEYTNTSAVPGYWNVTAYAHNENGSDIRTWWWAVTEDTTPPTVISHAPTGTKISIKTDITATFNETVNPSTLNNATVIVCNSSGGTVTGIVTSDSETNTTVTFDPLRELEYNETYNVTITEGVQDLAGNNMSSDFSWNFTTRSEILKTPFVISGYVTYAEGAPSNVSVNITNLNTSENFTVKTFPNSNYYRMQTDSTHLRAGDTIRFNATDGTNHNVTVHAITEDDIENGGLFMQNLTLVSEDPDLAISDWSREVVSFENETYTYNITYMVRNIGDVNASESTTSIYIDGEEKATDPVPALASGVNHTSTVGPINSTPHNKSLVIEICADGDNTVDERNEENNCLKKEFQINLEIEIGTRETDYWVDTGNGRFKITYKVKNSGDAYVDASNTTINITNVMINGSVSDVTIKERVPELAQNEVYENTSRLFTCLCSHTVNITACADADNELLERKEGDNCQNATLNCRASACKPDLVIVNHTETWINRTDRSFNIAYTIKNIGNGNAGNSTTRVHGKDDPIPKLAPGESNIRTVGPFNLTDKVKRCTEIKICADCNDAVSESNEENNCLGEPYVFGVPWLITVPSGEWVDYKNKTYNITYKVTNLGGGRLNESTAYLYIDDNLSATDAVPELAKVPSCAKGEGGEYSNTVGLGPFTMTGTSDAFQVRLECDGSYEPGGFSSAACVADDGTAFRCGDHITKSCKFTGDMYCGIGLMYTGRRYPHGLFIDRDDITIDGNGSAIIGDRDACACMYGGAEGDIYIAWTGVTNRAPGSIYPGYDNVTIKNLEVRNFCNGISIVNADNNRIENCSVHDNGATVQYNYGIYVENSNNITIDRCEAYNNTGILTDENVCGGHGINFEDDCNYCAVTNSNISHNYLSGILASPTCKYLYICNNLIEDNGYCNESGFCAGVNLHWKGGFGLTTNSTVENNVVLNNTGSGIYVTQGYTAIKNNTIRGSKNGTDVTGNGILVAGGSVTFLYNNTCCENEGTDIVNSVNSFATFGDDNTCDTTDNYDDDDSIGCSFYCGGVKGVCKGATKIFGCGDVVTESCTFNHSMSCRGCDVEYGLIVGAENVTIDGAGYKLSGNFTGIGIFSNYTGVTVKNLQVEDFSTGMKIENVSANIIENCIVCRNRGGLTGIKFSADNGTVRNNRIYDNNGTGIFVSGTNNIFENNTISRNKNGTLLPGYGIYFSADAESNNNNIRANYIGDNEGIIDIYNGDGASYIGENNTCDTTYNYNDTGTTLGCAHAWTTPDLVVANKSEDWVVNGSTDYRITYTIENIGKRKSREAGPSKTYLSIDEHHVGVADDQVGPLKPAGNHTSTFSYIANMSGESDTIKVCADGADEVKENNEANNFYCNDVGCYTLEEFFKLKDKEANNCLENVFNKESGNDISSIDPNAACVATDGSGTEYRCGDTVDKNCMFNGNMGCPEGHGLTVGKDRITIDGNGHFIIMNGTASCTSESDCGILNSGYDNVKIKNLEVVRFCNGMYLTSSEGEEGYVYRNTIQNCIVRDNGASGEGGFHGIKMSNVYDSTIRGNIIKNTIAHVNPNPSCEDGGNGIFMYQCCDNDITEGNKIYGNKKGGIFMKMQSSNNNISYNDVYENGQGGIIVRCKSSNDNIIEHNEIRNNYGSGIFIGGNRNKVRSNTAVSANKDGGPYYADYVGGRGCGIKIGRAENEGCNNKLYNNTICRNDYLDVFVLGVVTGNTGADNLCDTTENYNDTDVTAGCRNPCPGTSPIDLMITSKSEYWEVEGSTYYINYTVKNNGSETAPESITDIWINDDLMEEYQDQVGQLGAGESVNKTVGPFTMNRTSDKIEVRADGGATVEKVEKYKGTRYNNGLENTWTALPDLTVTKIEVPDELSLFKSNTVTARIENIGTVKTDADEAFTVALFVDGSASPTDTAEVSGLGAGESIPVPLTWKPLIKKDYTLKVVVDWESGNPEGAIHESDEMNNEKIIEITEKTVDVHDYTHGGPKPPPGEENITGYEPGPGEGTGVFGKDTGTKGQINESSVSGEEKWKKGNPFYGMGGEVIETVKVVAPVFLIIMVIIMIALFYSGYYKEKRGHRRNFRREK